MAQLIDTSVFITMERQAYSMGDLIAVAADGPVALSVITASELMIGVRRADPLGRRLQREAFVETILDNIPVLPFDLRVARVHAEVSVQLSAAGQIIGDHDMIIAATALAHGYSVLTGNLREFHRVPGLEVRRPSW